MTDLRQYIGIPYTEMNCWDLVRKFYADNLNIVIRHKRDIPDERKQWSEIDRGCEQIHDLLIFRVSGEEKHVGICLGHGMMLHSDSPVGVVIENYQSSIWTHRLKTIYRHI